MRSSSSGPIAVALALLSLSACTDPPRGWVRVFDQPDRDGFFDAVLTDAGHAILAGATGYRHVPPYRGDALILEIDLADGSEVSEARWGGPGFDQAWNIALAADGGYFVFGETDSYGAGDRDFFLLKLDSQMQEEWFRTYGTPRREWPFGMLPLAGGDLLLYGRTESEAGVEDAYAVRVNGSGEVVWEHLEPTPEDVIVLDALETTDGTLVLAEQIARDGALTELDSRGRVLWARRFEIDGWQYPSTIAATEDGFLFAGFWMKEGTDGQADAWLARTSRQGDLLWERSFGEEEADDYAMDLLGLRDGSFLLTGLGRGLPLWKVDAAGNEIWERRLDADSSTYAAFGAAELDDGGFLVYGVKLVVPARSFHAFLMRADGNGISLTPTASGARERSGRDPTTGPRVAREPEWLAGGGGAGMSWYCPNLFSPIDLGERRCPPRDIHEGGRTPGWCPATSFPG